MIEKFLIKLKFLKIIPFLLVLSTVWIVSHELPNATVTGKRFWFYAAVVFVSTAVFLQSFFGKKIYRFSWQDFLVALFCLLGLAITWFYGGVDSNKWVILLLLLPLYFGFRYILQDSKYCMNTLLFFLLITGLVEAFWGLSQLYGFSKSYNNLFAMTGSFFNPGPYAGYLALVLPLAVHYGLTDYRIFGRKWNRRYWQFYIRGGLSLLTIVCIALILPPAMSRAAWIAAIVGSIYTVCAYYNMRHKRKKNIRQMVPGKWKYIGIFMLCILLLGAYFLKKDSADGRWLIWKVSARVIAQYPLGVGLGNFSGSYGEQQAEYFASGAGSTQEQNVAGNPDYCFNEYIQICVELGILGLLLFTSIVYLALYRGIKLKRYAAVSSLGALLIFAAMSYPFNVLPFVIVFVFLLTSCFSDAKSSIPVKLAGRYSTIVVFGILLIVAVAGSYSRISTFRAYKDWYSIIFINTNRLPINPLLLSSEIYPELKHEKNFVFHYAGILQDDGQYEESNRVLQQGMKIFCDPMLYNMAGINYQLMRDYAVAELCFRKAANIVPNRLFPYYLLAKLYVEMELHERACEMAKIVLTKEPKVDSPAVSEMREEMNRLINDY